MSLITHIDVRCRGLLDLGSQSQIYILLHYQELTSSGNLLGPSPNDDNDNEKRNHRLHLS